jgi:3-isopropylmalate/(R)-2-methylmalate dehydratase small subunit
VTVDLQAQEIRTGAGTVIPFHVEACQRESLLAGLDDIGLTLRLQPQVRSWQARDRAARPWIWL